VFILLIVATVAAYYAVPSFRDTVEGVMAAERMPVELRDALFIGINGSTINPYRLAAFGFRQSAEPLVPAGRVSPDGTSYAYAQLTASSTPTTVDPSKSLIYIAVNGAQPALVAYGYAPAYLDVSHLVYFSPGGIVVRDLKSGATSLLFARATSTPLYEQVKYSPDRTMMLWTDAKTDETVLARVTDTSYAPVHVFVGLKDAVLTDTALYGIRPSPQGSQLWRYALDGSSAAAVLTFPQSLRIGQLFL
jgi:hypothetical protein